MIKLVLLDRDGVLNQDRADWVKTPDEWVPIAGAAEAVARLNQAGLKVAIVTNQSCIGRGMVSQEGMQMREDVAHVAHRWRE